MQIDHRSYRARSFLPRPVVFNNEEERTLVIVTPWGDPNIAPKVNTEIMNYVTAASTDVDITSPFDFYETQSSACNYLRIGMLLANDAIYRSENKTEYTAGFEVLALKQTDCELSWASVGQPSLLMQKSNGSILPIHSGFDLSFEKDNSGGSLPSELLGVAPICHVHCGQFRMEDLDTLMVYSGVQLPKQIWTLDATLDIQNCTEKIVEAGFENSFWLGRVRRDHG